MEQIQSQLQPHRLHVCLLQRGRDVHVHVEEPLHGASLLSLLDLQLGQQVDEPLEGALVAVDPEEVDLRKVQEPCDSSKSGGGGGCGGDDDDDDDNNNNNNNNNNN